jgi:peptide/nickel transport system substrate-binding protein
LLFEQLVQIDDSGQVQPSLAVHWDHNPSMSQWSFQLRPGVRFHDGSLLTPAGVAVALNSTLKTAQVKTSGDRLTIESQRPLADLLYQLAQPRAAIVSRNRDGSILGTGPFRLAVWEPGRKATFVAHEEYWNGRPFLDAVEIEMQRPAREQRIDLELGKAEVIELPPTQLRPAVQRGLRIWTSLPSELVALSFRRDRPSAQDAQLREALALCIDRVSIHNVLLQKQGKPAGSLLPQELTGYAFLFPATRNLDRARTLAARGRLASQPMLLAYEAGDGLAKTIAERLALNGNEVGIAVRPLGMSSPATATAEFDLRLVRSRNVSANTDVALLAHATALGLSSLPPGFVTSSEEELYAAEQMLLRDHWVIPLFHLPASYGLSPNLRTASERGLGARGTDSLDEWHFADLWLEKSR